MLHFLWQLYSLAWPCSEETRWQFKLFITGTKRGNAAGDIDRLGVGRRPEAAKNGPYFHSGSQRRWKVQWVKHETEAAAKKAANSPQSPGKRKSWV